MTYYFSYLEPVCCAMSSSMLLPDLHTGFSRGMSGGLVFPSLSEFSTVSCDPHSQSLWHSQQSRNRCHLLKSHKISIKCDVLCLVTQLCLTLCKSMDCSPPGFSVHGDSPGKNTGMGCHASSRRSSQLRDQTHVPCASRWILNHWTPRKVPSFLFEIRGSWKKQESSRKPFISALLTMPKPLTVWITRNCGKF